MSHQLHYLALVPFFCLVACSSAPQGGLDDDAAAHADGATSGQSGADCGSRPDPAEADAASDFAPVVGRWQTCQYGWPAEGMGLFKSDFLELTSTQEGITFTRIDDGVVVAGPPVDPVTRHWVASDSNGFKVDIVFAPSGAHFTGRYGGSPVIGAIQDGAFDCPVTP